MWWIEFAFQPYVTLVKNRVMKRMTNGQCGAAVLGVFSLKLFLGPGKLNADRPTLDPGSAIIKFRMSEEWTQNK